MGYSPSVRSRWLDIGQVLFLRVYGPRQSRGPQTRKKRMRPISSHLDQTSLVNKGFIIWLSGKFFCGTTRRVPREKLPRKPDNKSFIDQACSVKMAGYWPHCFFCFFLRRRKQKTWSISSHLDLTLGQ